MRLEREMLCRVSTILLPAVIYGRRKHGRPKMESIIGWDSSGCHGLLCFGLEQRARADQSRKGKCLLCEEVSGEAGSAFAQAGCGAGSIWCTGRLSGCCNAREQ